jgi:hypothetical protein
VYDFNTSLSWTDRLSRQKQINKVTSELNETIDQVDLLDTYRVFHPTEYTFFSATRGTLSKIDILGNEASLITRKLK